MILLYAAHFILSVVVGVNSEAPFPWLYFLGFLIMTVGASGLRGTLIMKDKKVLLYQVLIGLAIYALGVFVASRSDFGVNILGITFSSALWAVIGSVFAFLGTSKKHGGSLVDSEEKS